MCRRIVNLFIFEYKISENSSPHEKLNYQTVREYNKRFSGQRTLIDIIRDIPCLFGRIINEFRTPEGFMRILRILRLNTMLIGLILYILSPIDLIPEYIFGIFGIIDDVIVFLTLIFLFSMAYYSHLQQNN